MRYIPILKRVAVLLTRSLRFKFLLYRMPLSQNRFTLLRGMLAVMIACASSVQAHEAHTGWSYEAFCCNGNTVIGDCQAIPTRSVTITPGGYQLLLVPGDHRLITRSHIFRLKQSDARRSQDGSYHLCLFPDENTPRCFYAPDMAF